MFFRDVSKSERHKRGQLPRKLARNTFTALISHSNTDCFVALLRPFDTSMGSIFHFLTKINVVHASGLSIPSSLLRRRKLQLQVRNFSMKLLGSPFSSPFACYYFFGFTIYFGCTMLTQPPPTMVYTIDRPSRSSSDLNTTITTGYHFHCHRILVFFYVAHCVGCCLDIYATRCLKAACLFCLKWKLYVLT